MNQEPETQTIKLERVLTDAEFEEIYQRTFHGLTVFNYAQKCCVQTLMCAAIKYDRQKRDDEKDI